MVNRKGAIAMTDVFFASSKEHRSVAAQIAVALRKLLPHGWTVRGWWDSSLFPAGSTVVESLEGVPDSVEAAVVFFTPDDEINVRGTGFMSPRDNVIFEAGYFMSRFGRRRCAVARVGNVKIPGDLDGMTVLPLSDGKTFGDIPSDADTIFAWLSEQNPNIRMKVLAEDAMRKAYEHFRAGTNLDTPSRHSPLIFPLSAYPFFLSLLLDEPETEFRAIEVIGEPQVQALEHVYHAATARFKCPAFNAHSFHWYLWSDCPFQEHSLDHDKFALLKKTKDHANISRFIYLREPSGLPTPLFRTIYFYATQFVEGGAKAKLHFVIGSEHPRRRNEMLIRCRNKWFSAQRVERQDDTLLVSIEPSTDEPVLVVPPIGCLTALEFVERFKKEYAPQ
jgi:predicted nucleotide-binding protein with TIR-like domain